MIGISKLMKVEAALLLFLGLVHVFYLQFFVEFTKESAPFYIGASIYGIIYTLLGIGFLFNKQSLVIPALVLNGIGMIIAVTTNKTSLYGTVNISFILTDIFSVSLLIYLLRRLRNE